MKGSKYKGHVPEGLHNLYKQMVQIREFEEAVKRLYQQNFLRGSTHVYIGEEAIAVGACAALRSDDYITSTHRGHGHCIAKGGNIRKMMAELLGKATGYCKGKGGSMHIADLHLGILGANGIVGGGIPLAAGAGLSIAMRGTDQVCVCFFGDAACNQGSFHESANMAGAWKLPVIYLCENNGYGVSTPIHKSTAIEDLVLRAPGYGMHGVKVDGNDLFEVYEAVSDAVERAREGLGPTFIEAKTYRWEGHFVGDACVYRTKEEVEEWKKYDPIKRFREVLLSEGVATAQELDAIDCDVVQEIEDAIEYAKDSPDPEPDELLKDVYV